MVDDRYHDDIDELEEGPILPHRRVKNSADLDITPMIDIVFLLLIFFIVASVPDPQVEADLPHARHGDLVQGFRLAPPAGRHGRAGREGLEAR